MKRKKTLSIIPFFGGKSRMASFIADRLDYSCDIFVELFGGGCRTLLNKDPHKLEIYNEFDRGLCALMEMLSDKDTAQQLIDKLYYETEPTKDEFSKAKDYLYRHSIYYLEDLEKECKKKIEKYCMKTNKNANLDKIHKRMDEWWEDNFNSDDYNKNFILSELGIPDASNISDTTYVIKSKKEFEEVRWLWGKLRKAREKGFIDLIFETSDEDLAIATYLVYTLGFSGMGKAFVNNKFKTDDQYRKRILNLYDCADRLNGVRVLNLDAMMFFREQKVENSIFELFDDPNVMMFLDPSYLSPTSKNLGPGYAKSFQVEEHEQFLKGIQNAKCKIMVCNYDVDVYNKYLTSEKGWRKETYPTKTTSYDTSKTEKSNDRLEVIWCNY